MFHINDHTFLIFNFKIKCDQLNIRYQYAILFPKNKVSFRGK